MMPRFRRTRAGIVARLRDDERTVLKEVVGELLQLLAPAAQQPDPLAELTGMSGAEAPRTDSDPVLARLFPAAYVDDEAAAEAFRLLAHAELAEGKRTALQEMVAALDAVGDDDMLVLTGDAPEVWLAGLNDLRLALGVRLDVGEDWEDKVVRLDPDDPRLVGFAVYDWLTALQASLVDAVSGW